MSPKAVPQLADADALVPRLPHSDRVRYPVLVPNERGMARAEAAGAKAVAVFTAASESFTRANIGMTIDQSIEAFRPVLARAAAAGHVDAWLCLDRVRLPVFRCRRTPTPSSK